MFLFFYIFNSEIDTDHSTQFLHSTFQVIVDRPQLSLKYLSFHTSSLLQAPEDHHSGIKFLQLVVKVLHDTIVMTMMIL